MMGSERIVNFFEPSTDIDTFDARKVAPQQSPPVSAWGHPIVSAPPWKPDFADDESIKQAFGVLLASHKDGFKAGMELFKEELPKALWASIHWKNDPIVLGSRDAYLKTLKKLDKPLDKNELLYEVLASARNAIEDKDRVQFFKLYSEIAGFTGKVAIDASTNFNTNNNLMTIKLVKPENRAAGMGSEILDNRSIESKIVNENAELSSIKLKLVGGTTR
jgi:hypothetical protein